MMAEKIPVHKSNDKPQAKWNDIAHKMIKIIPIEEIGIPIYLSTGKESAQIQAVTGNHSLQCRFRRSWVVGEDDLGGGSINRSPRSIDLARPSAPDASRQTRFSMLTCLSYCDVRTASHS